MPTVKVYDGQQVQQNPMQAPTRSANYTSNDFGGAMGDTVADIGSMVTQRSMEMQAENREAEVKTKFTEAQRAINDQLYRSEDSYFNRRGKAAVDTYGAAATGMDDLRKEYAGTLETPNQQEAFNMLVNREINGELDRMSVHASRERVTYLNGNDEALIAQSIENGALHQFSNERDIETMDAAIRDVAARNGWGEEQTEQYRSEKLSTMHGGAIDNILATSPQMAEQYFEANKEQITPLLHDEIETRIKSQKNVEWVEERASEMSVLGGTRAERMSSAKEMAGTDSDKLALLRDRISYDLQQEETARQEESYAAHEQAYDVLVNDKAMSLEAFRAQNPSAWEAMDSGHQKAIRQAMKPTRSQIKTNNQAYDYMNGLIANKDFETARGYLMNEGEGAFSGTDFQHFNDLIWKGASETQDGQNMDDLLNADARRQFNDWAETVIGPEPPAGDEDDRVEWNKRRNTLNGMYARSLRVDMSRDDRTSLLDDMTQEVINPSNWFWDAKTIPFTDLPVETQEGYDRAFRMLNLNLSIGDGAFLVNSEINPEDLVSDEYQMASNALRRSRMQRIADGQQVRSINIRDVIRFVQESNPVPVE